MPVRLLNLVLLRLAEENEDDYQTPTGIVLCFIGCGIIYHCLTEPRRIVERALERAAREIPEVDLTPFNQGIIAALFIIALGLFFLFEGNREHGYLEWFMSHLRKDEED